MTRAILIGLSLVLGAMQQASAQELGRLFFTPEQRASLDARRKARLPDRPAEVAPSATTRVDGYVQRAGGRSTVWINGESVLESAQPEDVRVAPARSDPSRVSVSGGDGGRSVQLKVGGTLDRGSGETRDVIGDGQIGVQR